ncbi:MAG: hypothetical protein DHS80DRAFT_17961 [Piptocephalis tieghemiana]|nr:MAG: hypothetical protein DHS80DRAFT_17961 [Piptocephalis tieghemiana]
MENFAARLRSFSNPQSPWPHSDIMATPRLMALAGFYHKPLPTDRDRVECFLCHHRFGGWEPDDDPFAEHLKYSPDCPYAILVCPRRGLGLDPNEVEESEEVIRERQRRKSSHRIQYAEVCRRTFTSGWPYFEQSGRNADSMAAAGFIWAPGDDTPDAVLCLYCRLGLDSFDPDDDAW